MMILVKKHLEIHKYEIVNNRLLLLSQNGIHSNISMFYEKESAIIWKKNIVNIYDFVKIENYIYVSTIDDLQKTLVLSYETGEIVDNDFFILFHLPCFFRKNDEIICYANYKNDDIILKYMQNLNTIEILNPKKVKASRFINEDKFLNIEDGSIKTFDFKTSDKLWEFNLLPILNKTYNISSKVKLWIYHLDTCNDVLVLGFNDLNSYNKYLLGLSLNTGDLRWCHNDFNNFEIHKGKLYSIGFYGLIQILNIENGNIESEFDLSEAFKHMDINCEHRFNVTDTHIYFKHARKGKFGIINLKDMKLEEVHQLPAGNTISTEEYPISVGNRLYIRSSPQNNLFIYE